MNRRGFLSLFALAPLVAPALVNARGVGGVFAADVQKAGVLFARSDPLGDFIAELGPSSPPHPLVDESRLREIGEFIDRHSPVCHCSMRQLPDGVRSALCQGVDVLGNDLGGNARNVGGEAVAELGDLGEGAHAYLQECCKRGGAVALRQFFGQMDESALNECDVRLRDVNLISHNSAPSVGVAAPMVAESEVSSGNVVSGSAAILREARAC